MDMSIAKVQFKTDVRRLVLGSPASYEVLSRQVQGIFHLDSVVLKYVDDENEYITVSSDNELRDAFNVAASRGSSLKLYVEEDDDVPRLTESLLERQQGDDDTFGDRDNESYCEVHTDATSDVGLLADLSDLMPLEARALTPQRGSDDLDRLPTPRRLEEQEQEQKRADQEPDREESPVHIEKAPQEDHSVLNAPPIEAVGPASESCAVSSFQSTDDASSPEDSISQRVFMLEDSKNALASSGAFQFNEPARRAAATFLPELSAQDLDQQHHATDASMRGQHEALASSILSLSLSGSIPSNSGLSPQVSNLEFPLANNTAAPKQSDTEPVQPGSSMHESNPNGKSVSFCEHPGQFLKPRDPSIPSTSLSGLSNSRDHRVVHRDTMSSHDASCGDCGMAPIVGPRFTCTTCPDYSLCWVCEEQCNHDEAHVFVKITVPDKDPANDGHVVHVGFTCGVCRVQPIVGVRYRCTRCINFDICEPCEARGIHTSTHPLMKLRKAQPPPVPPVMRRVQRPYGARPPRSAICADFVRDGPNLGSYVAGSKFVKSWTILNKGTVAWPAGTVLFFEGGDIEPVDGRHICIPVPSTPAGETVAISVQVVCPEKLGKATGNFYLMAPDGYRFGPRLWVTVDVLPLSTKPRSPVSLDERDLPDGERKVSVAPSSVDSPSFAAAAIGPQPVVFVRSSSSSQDRAQPEIIADHNMPVAAHGSHDVRHETARVIMIHHEELLVPPPVVLAPEQQPVRVAPLPVPAPAAPAPVPVGEENPLTEEAVNLRLANLYEMGFKDQALNVVLLRRYEGRLQRVVEALLTGVGN